MFYLKGVWPILYGEQVHSNCIPMATHDAIGMQLNFAIIAQRSTVWLVEKISKIINDLS